jgi:hypothetical protein
MFVAYKMYDAMLNRSIGKLNHGPYIGFSASEKDAKIIS